MHCTLYSRDCTVYPEIAIFVLPEIWEILLFRLAFFYEWLLLPKAPNCQNMVLVKAYPRVKLSLARAPLEVCSVLGQSHL